MGKKWAGAVLALLLTLAMSAETIAGEPAAVASAEGATRVELFAGNGAAEADATTGGKVAVRVEARAVPGLFGAELDLRYDPDMLRPASGADIVAASGFNVWVKDVDPIAGRIKLAMTRQTVPQGSAENIVLAAIGFTALVPGQTAVALGEVKLVDAVPRRLNVDIGPAMSVTVRAPGGNGDGGDGGDGGGGGPANGGSGEGADKESDPLRLPDWKAMTPDEIVLWGVNLVQSWPASAPAKEQAALYDRLTEALSHLSTVGLQAEESDGGVRPVKLDATVILNALRTVEEALRAYNAELSGRGWRLLTPWTEIAVIVASASPNRPLLLELPADGVALLAEFGKELRLELPLLSLRIPPDALPLAAYQSGVELEAGPGLGLGRTVFELTTVRASGRPAEERLAKAGDGYKSAGFLYDFTLEAVIASADGETSRHRIARFEAPLAVSIGLLEQALQTIEPHKLGVYRFDESRGAWIYAGGIVRDWNMLFDLTVPGSYAVMSFDKSFVDVGPDHWALRDIELLTARHIVAGMDDKRFAPSQTVTRAQLAALTVRALGIAEEEQAEAEPSGAASSFGDVPDHAWHAGVIRSAVRAGLAQGVGGGRFEPDGVMTRQQLAVWLMRAYRYQRGEPSPSAVSADGHGSFRDFASVSEWARPAVEEATRLGLLQGKPGGLFAPDEAVTRAQAAAVISRLLNALGIV